jgi:hypothetical protein
MSPQGPLHEEDDIIELTEIVEKGSVPGSTDSDAADFEKELEDLLDNDAGLDSIEGFDDLEIDSGTTPSARKPADDEDDIDALLNDLEQDAPSAGSAGSASGGSPVVDPNEELQMPDMSDMDDLLGDVGAPAPSQDDDLDDLDALLNGAMDEAVQDTAQKEQPAAPDSGTGDETDAPDIDDLDALIEQASAAAPQQPQAPAAQKNDDPLSADDIDALLEQASAGTQQNAAAPEAEDAGTGGGADDDAGAPDIDDLDALIEQAAAAVPEQPQTPAAQKNDDPLSADDIDALLEQASAGTQQNAAAPEAEDAANGGGADDDAGAPDIDDLDELIGQASAGVEEPEDTAHLDEIGALIDDIQPPDTQPAQSAAQEAAAGKQEMPLDDLDDVLDQVMGSAHDAAPQATVAAEEEGDAAPAQPAAEQHNATAEMPSGTQEAGPQESGTEEAGAEPAGTVTTDTELPEEVTPEAVVPDTEMPDTGMPGRAGSEDMQPENLQPQDSPPEETASDEVLPQDEATGAAKDDTPAHDAGSAAGHGETAGETRQPPAAEAEEPEPEQTAGHEVVPPAAAAPAAAPLPQLMLLEERIAALETAAAEPEVQEPVQDVVERLLGEDSPVFRSLLAAATESAVAAVRPLYEERLAALEEQLARMDKDDAAFAARLDEIELAGRPDTEAIVHTVSEQLSAQLEATASEAAAKVLREEIAALARELE